MLIDKGKKNYLVSCQGTEDIQLQFFIEKKKIKSNT